jgi:hypothetical protein
MKRVVQGCLLLGIALLVIAAYSHLYETRSTGLLPYIDYPLRPYVLPLLILGVAFIISGLVLILRREHK